MNWLCLHVGTCTDAKLKLIAKRTGASLSQVVHAWVYHLERAADGDPRGSYGSIDPDEAELATDIPPPIWMAVTIAFEDRGLTNDGAIVNFDKRNYGNSTLRVQAFRERQKRLKRNETLQIADETLHETVKRSCNATGEERTGHTKNLTTTVPVSAREEPTPQPLNGHAHKNGNGVKLNLSPLRASRAPRREFTPEERTEAWVQKMIRFMRVHHSADTTQQAILLWCSEDASEKAQARKIFDAASRDYDQRKAAGTLQPMGET